jgi:hypothetical protein
MQRMEGRSRQLNTKKKCDIHVIMLSSLKLLWWGWCTVWGIFGFIIGGIKLWKY